VPPVPKAISQRPAQQPGAIGQSHINALATGRKPYLITKALPPKVRKAIELLVFDGLSRPEAAKEAGITDNWLYQKLKLPEVLKYYRVQCEVLRTGQRHRNIKKAIELRDDQKAKYGGKVVIEAMKFLENDYSGDHASNNRINVNVLVQPGYICDISEHSVKAKQLLQLSGAVIKDEQEQ
jgi:hypothetical protein